jgi:hypothetical protein
MFYLGLELVFPIFSTLDNAPELLLLPLLSIERPLFVCLPLLFLEASFTHYVIKAIFNIEVNMYLLIVQWFIAIRTYECVIPFQKNPTPSFTHYFVLPLDLSFGRP